MDASIREDIRNKLSLVHMSRPALIGMAAILALVAVASVHVLSGTATASDFQVSSSGAEAELSDVGASEQVAPTTIFVHVSGAVKNPGLYELEADSRVSVAIQAAGGFSDDADAASVNLARMLEDGEQILVASKNADVGVGASERGGDASNIAPASKVNVNTATVEELKTLPGIGASTAEKIVAERKANGSFKSVDDLLRVSGIGEKKLASIADLVCV